MSTSATQIKLSRMEWMSAGLTSAEQTYQIANNFGVSVAEIMNLNNLTSTLLSVGQTLLIPTRILDY